MTRPQESIFTFTSHSIGISNALAQIAPSVLGHPLRLRSSLTPCHYACPTLSGPSISSLAPSHESPPVHSTTPNDARSQNGLLNSATPYRPRGPTKQTCTSRRATEFLKNKPRHSRKTSNGHQTPRRRRSTPRGCRCSLCSPTALCPSRLAKRKCPCPPRAQLQPASPRPHILPERISNKFEQP